MGRLFGARDLGGQFETIQDMTSADADLAVDLSERAIAELPENGETARFKSGCSAHQKDGGRKRCGALDKQFEQF